MITAGVGHSHRALLLNTEAETVDAWLAGTRSEGGRISGISWTLNKAALALAMAGSPGMTFQGA